MISIRHRWPAGLCLAVLVSVVVMLPTSGYAVAGDRPAAASTTARPIDSSPQRAADPKRKWLCTKWRGSSSSYERSCARLFDFNDKIRIDYRERFYNEGPGRGQLRCSHAETTTWTFNVSATVEAEAGVIFAKLKTSVTAGVSRSTSTTRSTEITYPHPARTWAHCERGIHGFSFRGEVRKQTCRPSGCTSTFKDFKGSAPEAGFWRYGAGRGGVVIVPRVR